ncbi:transglycosylase domain-containing protein [Paeniroseomonas aquatica]|uniref:transglycosylase domain-containing protein n=1 Tax=Paeniroseomonas aquatica TaxID=373043 RepID=UPI00361D9D76
MSPPDYRAEPTLGVVPPPPPRPPASKPPKPRRRRRYFGGVLGVLTTLAAVVLLGGSIAAFGIYRQVAADLPDYRWLADYQPPQMSRIYAADSRLLAELATERRVFVPIEAIPRRLQAAFVSAEDQRFWEHHGVDPIGILRATLTAVENTAPAGGSAAPRPSPSRWPRTCWWAPTGR